MAQDPTNVTVVNTGIVANINQYNLHDDWNIFIERLEQYFLANRVEEERKVPVLLTTVSEAVYKILKNLCHPVTPSLKTFADLKKLLTEQFQPAVSVYRKRIIFDSLRQSQESVREWYVKVKTQAAECEFEASLEDRVRDKFVTGMKPGPILDRLCEEKLTTTLANLLDIAQSKEVLLQEARLQEVNRLQGKSPKERMTQPTKMFPKVPSKVNHKRDDNLKCFHCGKTNHDFKKCKFKDFKCNACNRKGHIAKLFQLCLQQYEFHILDNAFLVEVKQLEETMKDVGILQKFVQHNNMARERKIEELLCRYGSDTGCSI